MSTNPWDYLGSVSAADAGIAGTGDNAAGAFIASGYRLLQWIGILGCIVTMIIAIIRFTSSNANARAEAKGMFSKKLVLVFFLFTGAYCFGYVWGLFAGL